MGITIDAPGASFIDDGSPKIIADRALFADADMAILLEAGDPDAAFQIASRPGKIIAKHHVEALDLVMDGDRVVQRGDAAPVQEDAPVAKESAPAEDKSVAPAENKATKPAAKKRRIGRRKSGE